MGFFTARERAALGKSAEIKVQGNVRELVRHDFTPRRRPDGDLAGHVGTLMQRVAENSVRGIDDLILQLRRRRDEVLGESARIERDIVAYARLNQSTLQSTRIITESLASFNKAVDAPGASPRDDDDGGGEERDEALAQPAAEQGSAEASEGADASAADAR